ncbi:MULTISPECIES: N-acetylglutaminylglutamine amidotransferase [Desulfococcus]|jgi:asparagine synthase (glutamine-hydrolysing)|uniref:asparagine synthase (glutamine-hydrolyzing) n=1 Tax=Desulfococcus multivorans DSM 2059 TaxID=1121405 RepID=S7VDE8_DESML|nr:N-acetylglutaminylglutamine amidotransferase [Desulfococcus multivorans]AOY58253.1 AsnB: predicted asparagine synthetase [Desulfococcus multivorans]AQV00597.1 asparagine synthetase B [Desulfococcus multivorans]EPR42493.1 asparagine synthase family amidotransferase [Desulfococcus multivorans DSM 2059]MDX9817433.1 N-acetylglutaminylglutamine amidotransferase [Desulfococcus multivorans]SJZ97554.1 asparagine synthase (glutamine-hydrolysing) [Desulfococcus multivorans DSM 2059]
MCGICGVLNFGSVESDDNSCHTVEKMMRVLAARGPDAKGLFMQGDAAFGHRRLKIFDLSEKSHQPLVDNALGLAVVYNGALYNYRELRSELRDMGYTFFSDGDTEVLLKAYHAWGKNALARLNGMFAFAIRHRDSGKVVIGRDRLGIKPLYYSRRPNRISFASTLPALLVQDDVDREIDPVALHYYMTFHSVVPAPHTLLKGIRKLPPATLMTIAPDGDVTFEPYWRLRFGPRPEERDYRFRDWGSLLRQELENAVQRRLTADVSVGVLLSGGLDSSLVVGLLANAGQSDLNTFSIGFESVGDERGDEFRYSDLIARHYGTVHHKIEVDAGRVLPALERCVTAMSEPMVSHDCIGFYLLSEAVSKHVKVVQSGQGADEIFAGYHWYPAMMECDANAGDPLSQYERVFFDGSHRDYLDAVDTRFHGKNHSQAFVRRHFADSGADSAIDKALRLDTTVMLVEDPVKRVDNMTMAWGLEARVPFLDHEVVELAARIPAEHKIADGGKGILKAMGREIIPSEVIDRPKGYFPVPALKYFRGEYLDFVREILSTPTVKNKSLFNPLYVDRVLADPDAHITPLRGARLWQMALLGYWLTLHNV